MVLRDLSFSEEVGISWLAGVGWTEKRQRGGINVKNEFTAVVEPAEEGGYFAYCPELPEANGQGDTREVTLKNLCDAIVLVLEDRREQGLRGIPEDADTTVVTVE